MAVNEDLSAYSTTASSNTPGGSTNIGTDLDDHLRDVKKNIREVGTHARGPTAPANVFGRFWMDTTASTSSQATIYFADEVDWIRMIEIDGSANTAYAYADPALSVSTGTTLTAEKGVSGGGTFAANRSISLENVHTATAVLTNMTATVDPYGRIVSYAVGTDPSGAASNAQVQDRSSTTHYVSPATFKHHLGAAKFFVCFDASGTASVASSYNVDDVVRSAAGTYTINFNTGFTNTFYIVTGMCHGVSQHTTITVSPAGKATGSCQILTGIGNSYSLADVNQLMIVGHGFHAT